MDRLGNSLPNRSISNGPFFTLYALTPPPLLSLSILLSILLSVLLPLPSSLQWMNQFLLVCFKMTGKFYLPPLSLTMASTPQPSTVSILPEKMVGPKRIIQRKAVSARDTKIDVLITLRSLVFHLDSTQTMHKILLSLMLKTQTLRPMLLTTSPCSGW